MKIQFNPHLQYQQEAINSIVSIFEGQETCRTNFTVAPLVRFEDDTIEMYQNDLGIGNRLRLLPEDILTNVQKIQLKNGLCQSDKLNGMNFTVEMETGTGKTYVYLRTIFELKQRYGFTKFIIVVPSIAIKEGVNKALEMTEDHFKSIYDNEQFDYFVYNSQKLGQVRSFATNDYIQIMVINIDAFRKSFTDPEKEDKANIIHRPHDRMTGSKPIEFIQATNPIVIIDEPQSVDTTEKSREAIASLHPLCTLRYSATHVDKYNMMYKLDSVDAYEQKLVKQIEVAGIEVKDSHNKAYIKLLKVDNRRTPFTAQVEIDAKQKNGEVKRTKKTVKSGDDFMEVTGREVYDGYIIEDIYCEKGNEYISFTSKEDIIKLNEVVGSVDDDQYKRLQIRKTIDEHLDKELQLRPRGIKVLSLFFIDRVANYRQYDDDGNEVPGKYALWFEEEYKKAIRKPEYSILFEGIEKETAAHGVHNGYFAIDKKKTRSGAVDMYRDFRGEGTAQADENAYQLIMQDKETLLSFESKLKFIFSHSALREGWDNPNVFQICTLNETDSVMKKRQEVGRGLRIAVNQDGERVHGFDVNTLTIMANESYEEFARKLQKEIEDEEGIRFGVVEDHIFANITVSTDEYNIEYLGMDNSVGICSFLKEQEYIDEYGKVQNKLRLDLKNNKIKLPERFEIVEAQVFTVLRKVAGNLNIKNADDRKDVKLNKAVFLGEDFKELWNRIKYWTTYRVQFNSDALIEKCARKINESVVVGKARFTYIKSTAEISLGGVEMKNQKEATYTYDAHDFQLPDIISYLQNETNLTRRFIAEILLKSRKLESFKRNPQKFIEQVLNIIRHEMRLFIVETEFK